MKTQFDIEKVLEAGKIKNELEYERALIADRKLRLLSKENSRLKPLHKQLRNLIQNYENKHWSADSDYTESKIKESDLAELISEKERVFIQRRKELITTQLKKNGLNQNNLMLLLGHKSKTHMSELMNGLSPFTLSDLIVINRLLRIELVDLIPTTISQQQRAQIKRSIELIGTNKIKLSADDFDLVA